ncbi:InlB B-repeat-containing protein [Clostridium beijerinckii]|uniref:InlB B-repeat-containing protein n=1 Tax=Clostridium beijerinckii TaxID=1520 RepID=UPI00098CDBEF|nr:InlB B-repeat-containing protein [Clostridium beijerinckii]NRT80929.1 putative repeat protein (TIGR02543 family) [Clostridium beijerinckii]OOM48275.1 putative endo-beta-N-acetylglucosaminidase precursor [Clostridium beijerinckii]
MRKRLSVLLLVMLIAFELLPLQVNASTVSTELKVSSELTQWVLDEPTNTLYAISETGKNLIFINATTMSIEKNLPLNGGPTDIIKDNGKLYVAIANLSQIVIVDMASKAVTGILNTSSALCRIEKDGDKIYYVGSDQLYEYNIITNTDKKTSVYNSSNPDLAINTRDHILYIGESDTSGSNMSYYSTSDNKVISKTNYYGGYGFSYPSRNTIFDGTNVYYAGRDFKIDDPTRFNGNFGNTENVIYVNNGLVYTNNSIYSKDTHIKLGDYGFKADLVQASDSVLYIYTKETGSIKRFNDNYNSINSNNVISLISGKPAYPIPNNRQSEQINAGMSTLPMKSKLIQWGLNEPSNTLYGISEDDKTLFFINAQTLNLEKSLTFASSLTDIIEDGGNLYIALDDTNEIAVVDMSRRSITGKIYTSSDPYRIVKDGDKIYYAERDQHSNIYEHNLTTNIDQKISVNLAYEADLAINTEDHILYIGESGLSGSIMTYYSTTNNEVIGETYYNYGYGFHFPGRYTLFDGEKVYYAGFAFDKQDPRQILGQYSEEDVIFAKYGSVFTPTSIYDSKSYSLVGNTDNNFDLIEISDKLVMYLYNEADNSILRVDKSKISNVQFNSQGGSDVSPMVVDKNTLINSPTPPIKSGYTFAGWYKEAGCLNPWNFTRDKVTDDITLYANWTSVVNNGWGYSQGKWYFFNNGKMVINAWRQDSSKRWYYLGDDGVMVTNTWKQDSSKYWYYLGNDGSMSVNTWILYNKKWYYLNANGEMATGWIFYKGDWYYLYPTGEMASNTIIDRYILKENGAWNKLRL